MIYLESNERTCTVSETTHADSCVTYCTGTDHQLSSSQCLADSPRRAAEISRHGTTGRPPRQIRHSVDKSTLLGQPPKVFMLIHVRLPQSAYPYVFL